MSSPSPFFELLSWWRAALGMDFTTFYKFFIKRETVSPSERQAAKLAGLTDAEIDAGLTEHDKTMILEKLDQAARDKAARDKAESDQIARIEAAQAAARIQAESDQAVMNEIAYMTARDQATRDAQAALTKAAGDQATRDAQAARDQAAGQQAVLEQAALAAYNARNQAIQTSNVPQTAYVSPVVAPAPSLLPDETWPVNAIGQKPTGYGRTSTGVIAWYYPDEE